MNKLVNPNLNLPSKKYKRSLKISVVCANDFKCFSEDNFEIVTYRIMRNSAITRDHKVLFFLVFLERKALIWPILIKKILCQWELRDWLSYRGQQKTLAN